MSKCHICTAETELHYSGMPVCVKCDGIISSEKNQAHAGQPYESKRPPQEPLISDYLKSSGRDLGIAVSGKYRLTNPAFALVFVDGYQRSVTLPTGAFVDLDGKTFNGGRLMDVLWEGHKAIMFTEDLRLGELLRPLSDAE
jgi:hypothetical protein